MPVRLADACCLVTKLLHCCCCLACMLQDPDDTDAEFEAAELAAMHLAAQHPVLLTSSTTSLPSNKHPNPLPTAAADPSATQAQQGRGQDAGASLEAYPSLGGWSADPAPQRLLMKADDEDDAHHAEDEPSTHAQGEEPTGCGLHLCAAQHTRLLAKQSAPYGMYLTPILAFCAI